MASLSAVQTLLRPKRGFGTYIFRVTISDIEADERHVDLGQNLAGSLEIRITDTRTDSYELQKVRVGISPGSPLLDGVVLVDAGDQLERGQSLSNLEGADSVPEKRS